MDLLPTWTMPSAIVSIISITSHLPSLQRFFPTLQCLHCCPLRPPWHLPVWPHQPQHQNKLPLSLPGACLTVLQCQPHHEHPHQFPLWHCHNHCHCSWWPLQATSVRSTKLPAVFLLLPSQPYPTTGVDHTQHETPSQHWSLCHGLPWWVPLPSSLSPSPLSTPQTDNFLQMDKYKYIFNASKWLWACPALPITQPPCTPPTFWLPHALLHFLSLVWQDQDPPISFAHVCGDSPLPHQHQSSPVPTVSPPSHHTFHIQLQLQHFLWTGNPPKSLYCHSPATLPPPPWLLPMQLCSGTPG